MVNFIPSGVKTIDVCSFYDIGLTSVTIPYGVETIGESAFESNSLTSIIIPDSVTLIDTQAFEENNLTSVTLSNSLREIGTYAFMENRISSISIPDSTRKIGFRAFYDNQLNSVVIPSGVRDIYSEAFASNNFNTFMLPVGSGEWRKNYSIIKNGGDTVSVNNGYYRINQKPIRQSGVAEQISESIMQYEEYILDLSVIFEDGNNDDLTFEVKIDEAEFVGCPESYVYSADTAGEFTLVFRAYDDEDYSEDAYTVQLNVAVAGDVNDDGTADMLDIVALAQQFNNDYPEYDQNADGVINIYDIVAVAKNIQTS